MQVYNDELYHYGKLGMKWGHRIAKPIMGNKVGNKLANSITNYHVKRQDKKPERQEFKKEYRQMYKDQLKHPIHSLAAQAKLIKEKPLKALNMDLKTTKQLNVDVKRRVDNEARKKKKIKEYEKQINAGASTVGRIYNKLTNAGKYQAELMYAEKHKNR